MNPIVLGGVDHDVREGGPLLARLLKVDTGRASQRSRYHF
jgi:hypothetical protein